ncbi:MAG: glycosyltransferase family 2 protein [Candidatus Dojkabacteria bacterium]
MKVFVLIPTKDRKDLLLRCLESLSKQTYKNIEIIVVDDGSTDGTKEILEDKKVTTLNGNGNLWWSGSMRKGIDYILIKSNPLDFVLIQNDDTFMSSTFVENLVKKSEVSSRMILGTPVKDSKTNELIYNSHRIVNGSFRPVIVDSNEEILKTDTLSGRGVLVPIEIFKKGRTFSKLFVHYAADYDFFCRAKKWGFELGVYSQVATISTNSKPNLSKRISSKKKITMKEFQELFFSRRSSSNLKNSILITLLYVPFGMNLYGIFRIFINFLKFFFVNFLTKNILYKLSGRE